MEKAVAMKAATYDRVGTGTSLQSRRARVQGLPNEEGECNGD